MKKIRTIITLHVLSLSLLFSSCTVENLRNDIDSLLKVNSTTKNKVTTTDLTSKTDIDNTKSDLSSISNMNENPTVNFVYETITYISGEMGINVIDPEYKLQGDQIQEFNCILRNSGTWTITSDLPQRGLADAYSLSDKNNNRITLFAHNGKTAIMVWSADGTTTTDYYTSIELFENVENFISMNFNIDEDEIDIIDNDTNLTYNNDEYGFKVNLPYSWKGYIIINDTWEGIDFTEIEEIVETGPIIYIRHPLWTDEDPRQDIPIMVFTFDQWSAMYDDEFHIGIAPANPSELARNSEYVFALPARYNFSFLTGYEEVEDIIHSGSVIAY